MDCLPAMGHFRQVQGVMDLPICGLLNTSQGHPGGPAPWIKFEGDRLHLAVFQMAILEPNDKGHAPMDDRATSLQQDPRSLLRTGHERLMVPVQNKDTHRTGSFLPPKRPPYGAGDTAERAGSADPSRPVGLACLARLAPPDTPTGF